MPRPALRPAELFHTPGDYFSIEKLLFEAHHRAGEE
jgi:hypothetical protein